MDPLPDCGWPIAVPCSRAMATSYAALTRRPFHASRRCLTARARCAGDPARRSSWPPARAPRRSPPRRRRRRSPSPPCCRRDVTEWDEFTGRLEAVNTVAVRPRVSGYVSAVRFTEGALVRKGDLLFQIDPRPFQAEVDRLRAELSRARSRRRTAPTPSCERAERLARRERDVARGARSPRRRSPRSRRRRSPRSRRRCAPPS